MLFFMPFFLPTAHQSSPSLSSPARAPRLTALPMLPAPNAKKTAGDASFSPFGEVVSQAAEAGVESLRQVLSVFSASMTALGSASNAAFAQVAAALATERAARATASAFGTACPIPAGLQAAAYTPWQEAWTDPFSFSPFTAMWFGNSWLTNPWSAFAQAFDMWAGLWAPPSLLRDIGYGMPARNQQHSMTVSVPGFSLGFTWDPRLC
jgi:hypothetical protein